MSTDGESKRYYQAVVESCRAERSGSDAVVLRLDLGREFFAQAGQFVVLEALVGGRNQWGRPFTLVDVNGSVITLFIKVRGPNTQAYSKLEAGQTLEVLGPQGQPLSLEGLSENVILVGGGIGSPALIWPARDLLAMGKHVSVLLGGYELQQIYGLDFFQKLGLIPGIITDTDTAPFPTGQVTELLVELLNRDGGHSTVMACGPKPMLEAVHKLCLEYGNECWVGVEELMACGMGSCLGCAIEGGEPMITLAGKQFEIKHVCHDGPWLNSRWVHWDSFARQKPIWLENEPTPVEVSIDLSTRLGPLTLLTPLMTASGTLSETALLEGSVSTQGLGAVVSKGISLMPRSGNPMPRLIDTASGMLNAIGLENVGLEVFLAEKLPLLLSLGVPVIVNIFGNTLEEYVELAERLDGVPGVAALEINISCPNVKKGGMVFGTDPFMAALVVSAVRRATSLPLITKLTPNVTDIGQIARAAVDAGSDMLSAINTVAAMGIDVHTRLPRLANVIGGLSGPAIKPIALRCVFQIAQAFPKVPIIGIGGIATGEDVAEFTIAGASAVQVGTANFNNRQVFPQILDGLERELRQSGCRAYSQLVGTFMQPLRPLR